MSFSLIWMPEVLRAAGLKVAETEGWANRGRSEMGRIRGVMCHHTGNAGSGNMPTLNMLKVGRGGPRPLRGPLSQLGLGRDGTYYVVAAGRANHAGEGDWKGFTNGNSNFIGIEAENGGTESHDWPEVQLDAYQRGVAAILKHVGLDADMCCGHREYALPPGRKPDPLFDMNQFRASIRSIMLGTGPSRPLIPAADPNSGKPTLRRSARGNEVEIVQKEVGVPVDGIFGPGTEAAVRRFQRDHPPLVPDGIVGPKTWAILLGGDAG